MDDTTHNTHRETAANEKKLFLQLVAQNINSNSSSQQLGASISYQAVDFTRWGRWSLVLQRMLRLKYS